MATYSRFEDLEIWQKARQVCQWINEVVESTPLKRDFRLRDQIEASSGSIMDNAAEGFERSGNKEFIYFLFVAKGSAGEVRSQLYRLLDKKYIPQEVFEQKRVFMEDLSKQINRFINYLKQSGHKGWHFKENKPGPETDRSA